ncbi:hypothetical protein [Fimbriiglobus ruber]|uniref:Uncharacterized protein n=1 Tax=Fimbriiglobus ruber TaxID=1908690 RepID=A0A225DUM8_9BACT|nr:hypothetical protein [Fimbriiglobus ruber]OWK45220.1 hypothetical protein FRUB_01551 [Fimbriiglobus ruber]
MILPRYPTRAIVLGLAGVAVPVLTLLGVGVSAADGKAAYDVVRDLFVPLVGPLVAVLVPVIIFFVIPLGQNRQRLALDLCAQYYSEEMRDARNTAWRYLVTEQRQFPPVRRAERLAHFIDYLSVPEINMSVDAETDAIYQKASRVLDFFAMVDGCLARGVADPDLVRDFLLYYYLWWRDEIMVPIRKSGRTLDGPKSKPVWWDPLVHLDALGARGRQ